MKRLHVHVGVTDLAESIRFYSTLFAANPTVVKEDYAKWMLEDPRVNFAISAGNRARKGIEHLGLQVDSPAELGQVYGRLKAADRQSSRKAGRHAAMPRAKKAGSRIRTGSSGKPSLPTAMQPFMATARCSTRSRRQSRFAAARRRPRDPGAKRPTWLGVSLAWLSNRRSAAA